VTITEEIRTGRAAESIPSIAVFLDLDTVLLVTHPGKYGPELGLQADLPEAIERLSEVAGPIVVLVEPTTREHSHGSETRRRVDVLRDGLGPQAGRLTIAMCSHGEDEKCDCAKPGHGLIEQILSENALSRRGGWYVGGDQEGMVVGRGAGLKTIRIGPAGEDHLSAVHRADYEARDLLDAANRILLEVLAAP
jgi:histidinol phosphatase-like enzyme